MDIIGVIIVALFGVSITLRLILEAKIHIDLARKGVFLDD